MILSQNAHLLAVLLAVNFASDADAHGYLKTPRSRNYYASQEGLWFGGTENDPAVETCPHCLNIGGTEARCGFVGDHNYDLPPNAVGGIMPAVTQGCYKPGADITFESVLTAHHMGHFAFKACAISHGEVPTQECFDTNPLTFLSDELYGANADPLYPERAYIPRTDYEGGLVRDSSGDYLMRHTFRLPAGLSGDLVLIQWHYVTGNSCKDVGYDTYDWPDGFYPGNLPVCSQPLPHDGRGVPEQFWNCAELIISNDCEGPDVSTTSSTTTSSTTSSTSVATTDGTGATVTTTGTTTVSSTTTTQSPGSGDQTCAATTAACGADKPCGDGLCCSQWGYCGATEAYCGACCQNGSCWNDPSPPSPTPPSPSPPTTSQPTNEPLPSYTADHGEDSRLIAYLGNWQSCPTDEQVDAYSHLVVAFSVSYMWDAAKNQCNTQCDIGTSVPVCNNANNQALVDKWRSMGKKVILSFGGAGMGGSWSGDPNNCWDHCFGKEDQVSDSLVTIIDNQNFDGIDIDYEYCYDVNGLQSGRCAQRTSLYSDEKAQNFLDGLTSKLRVKLDALQVSNGYNRGRYEITHAPMDIDISRPDSKYYQILKNRRDDLDFLMPQMYNGLTRPVVDGVEGVGAGSMSSVDLFGNLANDLFDHEPHKVVFGFCISDCSGTGSNANAADTVQVLSDLKSYNNGEFGCNGGAFFWVAQHDVGGSWSDPVLGEVAATAGCSNPSSTTSTTINTGATVTTTPLPTSSPITSSPTSAQPTKSPSTAAPTVITTSSPITQSPSSAPVTASPTVASTPSPTSSGSLVISKEPRCGASELDARETCGKTCSSSADCESGEWCWGLHDNYCDSIPKRTYESPVQSTVNSRCGLSEIDARTFCGAPCAFESDCEVGSCFSVHSNYCDSPYTEE